MNTYQTMVDTWLEGDYVFEEVLYNGGTYDEADLAVEEWFESSRFLAFWDHLETMWGIVIAWDTEGDKLQMTVQKTSGNSYVSQLTQKLNYKRYGYKTAMEEKTYRIGKVKSNFVLANAMNSFTDNQVAGLIASGAINQKLIDEYIKGQNINLDFDISQLTNNTSRLMGFTDVSDNVVLSKVLNSMSDQQVYELLASGTIDIGLVNEYIQDGANAPILPCGSSDCEMFPKAGNIEELIKSEESTANIKGVEISSESLKEAGISKEEYDAAKSVTSVGNTLSIIDGELRHLNTLGELMAPIEVLDEVQQAASDAAAEAGRAAAEAANAESENVENAAAKADPDSEHYIPPDQEPGDPK